MKNNQDKKTTQTNPDQVPEIDIHAKPTKKVIKERVDDEGGTIFSGQQSSFLFHAGK